MVKVATTMTSSIAAPRRPFYAWLVPGVFSDELETVLSDSLFISGASKTTDAGGPVGRAGVAAHPSLYGRKLGVREVPEPWPFTDDGSGPAPSGRPRSRPSRSGGPPAPANGQDFMETGHEVCHEEHQGTRRE